MGIKNLNAIIKRYAPDLLNNRITIDKYCNKRIAVDACLYMYKYKSVYGANWKTSFSGFIRMFEDTSCVFVFDSKKCIAEKVAERINRSNRKKQTSDKLDKITKDYEMYKTTGQIPDSLRQFEVTNINQIKLRNFSTEVCIDKQKIEEYISKTSNSILPIYSHEFETIKEMCTAMGVLVINSDIEAEKMCALLCHENKVDAIMTEDTDAYAFLTPVILCKVSGRTCTEIKISDVLEKLNLSPKQFVDMCILCGTDFSQGVKGVGPVRAYTIIKTYNRLEDITAKYDISHIDYIKIRKLFELHDSNVEKLNFKNILYPLSLLKID